MIRTSLLFLVIALIATIGFIGGFAISVVPGWHTEVAPPYTILSTILLSWLYVLSIGYFLLERKNRVPSRSLVIAHLILTLFYFIYANEMTFFFNNAYITIILPLILFTIGQVIFLINFIRNLSYK